MKQFIKWGLLILVVIIVSTLTIHYISYKVDTKVPEIEQSIDQIVEENKENLDIEIDQSNIKGAVDIYRMIHEMANTLIVAEDGLIYGKIPINDQSINRAMVIIKDTTIITEEERLVFMNILQSWKKGDFLNGVQAHNYAWTRLDGTIGRAKDLKSEYK